MPGMERLARDIAADAAATEYDCGWRFGPGQRPIRVSVRAIEGGWEAYAFYVREDRDMPLCRFNDPEHRDMSAAREWAYAWKPDMGSYIPEALR